ncbi:hypothetical protein B1748_27360 [Paenibacillus sp. MY03]|uniref:hypothetical protein n=1 Tax=Paenibacillus sp. MY03 TaxID=302980 RepID=UPI000B3C6B01|nr:hypothetical protein [Paenibacillus sp. MY03]OUS71132.1 hypothetical protein B1748_27360 [Paenibacillus sp. MY03]
MKKIRIYSMFKFGLITILVLSMLAACSKAETPGTNTPAQNPGTSSTTPDQTDGTADGGMTNLEGYPITKEPITIKAVVSYSALRPEMDTTEVWKYIAEKTNINVEVEVLKDSEKVDLMFASNDYPDILLAVGINANQMTSAVEGDQFVEMKPLIEQYAPTWNRFMEENKLVYNGSLASNGKLYGLPFIDFAPFVRNLRDQWIMMDSWLNELQIPIPKTTEEFKNALIAIKENAGKGSIPSDVIPYYFMFDRYVGGQFDIYGSFGVYITHGDYLYVDNGVVKDQSTNPAIKEPLKYLRELYSAGVIPPEVFTDDFNTYAAKISSLPPVVGSYHSYENRQPELGTSMGPLDSGNGQKPLIRSQAYIAGPANAAIITKNNKYPVATARLLEAIASDIELGMTISRGIQGVTWDFDSEGKAYQLFWEESPDKMTEHSGQLGLHNSIVALRDQDFYENKWKELTYDVKNNRAWAYENVYKDVVMPNDMVLVEGALDADDVSMMKQYQADLTNYRKAMFADFITGKQDIDAQWDAYVKQMNNLGLEKFVGLKQKGYDVIAK